MSEKEMFERLKQCVLDMDEEGAKTAANDAIAQKLDPLACIEEGLSAGMKVISDKFDNAEIYVPQIILSAEAFTAAVDILSAQIQGGYAGKGKIIRHNVMTGQVTVRLEDGGEIELQRKDVKQNAN